MYGAQTGFVSQRAHANIPTCYLVSVQPKAAAAATAEAPISSILKVSVAWNTILLEVEAFFWFNVSDSNSGR